MKKDKRLKSKAWRARHGFDNIDPKPSVKIAKRRTKYEPPIEREISEEIDEVFLRA